MGWSLMLTPTLPLIMLGSMQLNDDSTMPVNTTAQSKMKPNLALVITIVLFSETDELKWFHRNFTLH
jgi:hypothetical protein